VKASIVRAVQLKSVLLLGWQVWQFALLLIILAQIPWQSKRELLADDNQYRYSYLTESRQLRLQCLDLSFLLSGL
jgi:hypothetical protein